MSTPAWKKRARQKAQAEEKKKREHEKKFKVTKKVKSNAKKDEIKPYYRETPSYPSESSNSPISYEKPERIEYTGDYIKGIAVMHKSNLVPVSAETDPRDYSTMRRN
jgi:hypothetical protein